MALDIDTTDAVVIAAIESAIPVQSQWKRVGKKGYVAVFRFSGEKTFRVKDKDGKTVCELLSAGTQVVLPPSIHPDTGLPYTANCELLDVIGLLPTLPMDFEKNLRDALEAAGVKLNKSGNSAHVDLTAVAGCGGRDDQATNVAGHFAHVVSVGQMTLVEALRAACGWVLHNVEQRPGDEFTEADMTEKVLRFVKQDAEQRGGLPPGWNDDLPEEIATQVVEIDTRERPLVQVRGGELVRTVDLIEAALMEGDPDLFQQNNRLLRLVENEVPGRHGVPTKDAQLVVANAVHLRERAMRVADFEKWDSRKSGGGGFVPCDCPKDAVEMLVARTGSWKFRPISGFLQAPTILADGRILSTPGYDAGTGLLYAPNADFTPIPENPTKEEAEIALARLVGLIQTFEPDFVSPVDRAVWVALVLTALIRPTLRTAPLFGFSAPCPGTGKTFLADLAAWVAFGRGAPVLGQGKDAEELEKRLSSRLLAGSSFTLFDNCTAPIGGDFLNAVLTAQETATRVLGKSEAPERPTAMTLVFTGNNLKIDGDTNRRAIISRLDPRTERPEIRPYNFDPYEEVQKHRVEFVVAGLTILRAFALSGWRSAIVPLQSFKDWSERVRDALVWLGLPDVVTTQETNRAEDPETLAATAVFEQWWEHFADNTVGVAEVIKRAIEPRPAVNGYEFKDPEFREALLNVGGTSGAVSSVRFGKWLSSQKDRYRGGFRLTQAKAVAGSARWCLNRI